MDKVTVQTCSGENKLRYAAGTTRKYTPGASGSNTGKQRTVICYNCKGEGHIAKQCTKPKRKRDETWFNDKVLSITHEDAAYQADDLDAYDSDVMNSNQPDCHLMANQSRNGSDALTEYLSEAQQETIQNSNSSAQQDVMILSMFEQLTTQVMHCTNVNLEYKSAQALTTELDRYKDEKDPLPQLSLRIPKQVTSDNVVKRFGNQQEKCSIRWDIFGDLPVGPSYLGNACPLTRITTTNEVPSRKPIVLDSESPKPVVKLVYSRKPRKNKNTESVSKTKVIKPKSANKQEPSKSWGSTKTNIPSTSLTECSQNSRMIKFKDNGLWNIRLGRAEAVSQLVNPKSFHDTPSSCENLAVTQWLTWVFSLDMHPQKAFRIYNRRTRRIIETIHVDFDELTAMASEHSSSGPALHEMTPVTISSGLVPNPPSSTPFVPPSRSDWDLLFQPMFDESLNPPPYVDLQAPEVIAPIPEVVAPEHAVSTGSPSSTTVDQDAPSSSNSHTTQETQTPIISHDVEEDNHDIEVAHMGNDPYFGIPIPEVSSDPSSSSDVIHTIVPPDHQVSEHNSKWTKDHPLENIIGALDRPVSTRLQLHEQALFCYYDAFLTSVKPKNYKDALTQACWIKAMQEELHEFERLEVWELVPPS
ncbi:retrovirus-related pol polyprotein from transposon TNT 1-94 [Tanacetum coccineum]